MIEQEPVYVPSDKLRATCQSVLGKIYDYRRTGSTEYIQSRVQAYNAAVDQHNARWWNRWRTPRMYITPFGMEEVVRAELETMAQRKPDQVAQHPMIVTNTAYGDLEHEAKDAMIQCEINDTVLVSSALVRGVSHFGLPLDFLRRHRIGF